MTNPSTQPDAMRQFYRFHAAIYDATRWAFLFGRKALLRQLPIDDGKEQMLLEVGSGTGYNLYYLAQKHPLLHLAGVDVSPDMLGQAGKRLSSFSRRLQLFEQPYGGQPVRLAQPPDVILFSYALTMFNPGWETAIERALQDLPAGGRIAVVDFHNTPVTLFRRWMTRNHVRMDGHLLPFLQARFRTEFLAVHPAWLGMWQYFMYVGQKVQ